MQHPHNTRAPDPHANDAETARRVAEIVRSYTRQQSAHHGKGDLLFAFIEEWLQERSIVLDEVELQHLEWNVRNGVQRLLLANWQKKQQNGTPPV